MEYITKPVIQISFESLVESSGPLSQLSDDGKQALEAESFQNRESLINFLTNRQKEVVELLSTGMTREEVAESLDPPVVIQAVHQIVLRIRKRLSQKAGIPMTGWRRTHGNK